jgi:hypothetical protein
LAEALSAGCPAIVPARTWMARQLARGGGETFEDFHSFLQAVRRLIDDFDSYRRQAEGHKANWRGRHSPDALVAAIVGSKQTTDMAGFPTIARSIPIVASCFGGIRPAA